MNTIITDHRQNTSIVANTTAETAASIYLEKMSKIESLRYECDLLVEKYHSEMRNADIPFHLNESSLTCIFHGKGKNKSVARKRFLTDSFSGKFLKTHKVQFMDLKYLGSRRIANIVVLLIGDYLYEVTIPVPANIVNDDDKEKCMGRVKFRVDCIPKSATDKLVKAYKPIQMPTYDWKECFEAIEADVEGIGGD